ncbi:MAG: YqgE/AlgH family protein [Mariprofundaceae bacterium]
MQYDQLKGRLLLATPSLRDPSFHHTAILLCHQDQEGSMGLIINKEHGLMLVEVLKDLNFQAPIETDVAILDGGPIDSFRGFILHDNNYLYESTLCINADIHLTTSRDILEQLANGSGPDQFLFVLGYAGWQAGQLEQEIHQNDWLIADSSAHILFETPTESRWMAAANALGISKGAILSEQVGHA